MNEKKKILIVSMAYFPRFIGGAEVAIKEITDRLGDDIEFHLITLRYDSVLPKESLEGKVHVHRIGLALKNPSLSDLSHLPLRALKPWFQLGAYYAAGRLHKEHNFDVVWGMMSHTAGVPAGLFKKRNPEVRYVLTLQEGDPTEHIENQMRFFGSLFKQGFVEADVVQAISNFLAAWARKMQAKMVTVVPNGVNVDRFSRLVSPEERVRIRKSAGAHESDTLLVTASRLVKKNGVDTVIEAMPLLPAVRFLIAGDGPDRQDLEALCERLGVQDRVTFMGEVSNQDLPSILASSNIFVRASRSEGQGIAFIEAMASRIPVIGTSVGGIPDFLTEGETGFVTIPESPKGIAAAVERIIKNPGKTQEVVQNAFELVEEKYTWETIAEDMRRNVFKV